MRSTWLLGIMSIMAAQPALAQYREPYAPPYQGYRNASPRQLIDQLARRVEHDRRYGIIQRDEAYRLRAEVERLRQLEYQFGNDGYSQWERRSIARQIDRVRSDMIAAEQNRFGRSVIVPPRNYPDMVDRWNDEDARPDNGLDNGREFDRYERRYEDRDQGYDGDYDRDGDTDMNDLRGPPPPMHDEGD
jgi:hypothetical protein